MGSSKSSDKTRRIRYNIGYQNWGETNMDRRTFLKTIVVGGGLTAFASNSQALKLFPNPSKQKWAILFGSRYGSTRDASLWISEGMGGIADAFDARENPDLSSFALSSLAREYILERSIGILMTILRETLL